MKRKWWKILLGSAAVLCLFIAGNFHTDAAAGKVTEKNGVVIQAYTEIDTYREEGNYKAPSAPNGYSGYVFAGWYTDIDLKNALNSTLNSASEDITNVENTYYAKFVPKEILGVRVQVSAGTTYEIENTNVRFITTVDSKYYSKVGFDVELNGTTYNGESNRVYRKLYVVNTKDVLKDYLPQNVFHGLSQYFLACKLTGVKHADYGDLMKIRPYWVTLDGTKVYGDTVNKTVNQAYTSSTASVTATQFATFDRDTFVGNSSCYAQGGCTDGTYYYQAFVYQTYSNKNDDENDCVYIGKYSLVDGKENNRPILQSENLDLHHANDMTYNKDLTYTGDEKKSGLLVICHNAPYNNRVSFVDPDTLEIVNPNNITDFSNNRIGWKGIPNEQYIELEGGLRIFAIEYNSALKQYVVGISGGQRFRILAADFSDEYGKEFEPINNELANFTTQGVGADDKYIYFVLHNRTKEPYNGHAGHVITVYDWQGNAVKVINIVTDKGINVNEEPENISIYDNVFYVGVGGWDSLKLYQLKRDGWSTEIIPENEAYIGLPEDNEYYTTLEKAVQNVKAGETITIVAENIEINSAMCIKVPNVKIKNETDKNVVIKRSSDYVGPVFKNSAEDLVIERNESGSLMFAGNNYAGQSYVQNISGGTMTLNGLTFKNIETTESGAAVCATSGTVTIDTCEFKNNIARTNGGALCIEKQANAVVTNSKFITNKTINQMGGAIYNYSNNEDGIVITDCTFDGNSAASNGGAIYNANGGKITLCDNNAEIAALFANNDSKGQGGAICIGSGTLIVNGYDFVGNNANRGGAIRISKGNCKATLEASVFKKNTAQINGGAISNASEKVDEEGTAAVIISSCAFGAEGEGNSSRDGGAIYNENSKLYLCGTNYDTEVFQDNEATNNGGAIYVASGTLEVSGYQFVSNHSNENGGVIYTEKNVTVTNSIFTENTANEGGAIQIARKNIDTVIDKSVFTNNSSTSYGGAICNYGTGGIVITDSTFGGEGTADDQYALGNKAGDSGGAIYHANGGTITLCDNDAEIADLFANNDSEGQGGAICIGSGTLIVNGYDFVGNNAYRGGAIRISKGNCTATLEASVFKKNTAQINGGAISNASTVVCEENEAALTVLNCVFGAENEGNSSKIGGAIHNESSKITVTNSQFIENKSQNATTDNTTGKGGGAVNIVANSEAKFDGEGTFISNRTNEWGGAIYMIDSKLEISGYTFDQNSAKYAGALFVDNVKEDDTDEVAEVKISDSVFTRNSSTQSGGASYVNGRKVTFTDCTFGGTSTSDDAYALGNKAKQGGAICSKNGNIKSENCNFISNKASDRGGALYLTSSGEVTLTGGKFENNYSNVGGAITTEITMTITNVKFTDNTATKAAPVIRDTKGIAITLTGCNIIKSDIIGNGTYVINK